MAANKDVHGTWLATQANHFIISFTVFQKPDGTLTGSASTTGLSAVDNCTGMVSDTSFVFTVPWSPGDSVGEYSGTFNLEGRIVGLTVDKTHAQNIAAWVSQRTF